MKAGRKCRLRVSARESACFAASRKNHDANQPVVGRSGADCGRSQAVPPIELPLGRGRHGFRMNMCEAADPRGTDPRAHLDRLSNLLLFLMLRGARMENWAFGCNYRGRFTHVKILFAIAI